MRYFTLATILVALVALGPRAATAKPPHGVVVVVGGYRPVTPYVVQRPIVVEPAFSGLPIKITNPAASGATLSYALNGATYSIPPGYSQDLTLDRSWVISFSRGGNFGEARYALEPGSYSFANTEHGWELFHTAIAQPGAAPAGGLPPNPAPAAAPATPPALPPQ